MLIYGGKSKYCFKILINQHTYWFATAQLIKLRNSSTHQPINRFLKLSLFRLILFYFSLYWNSTMSKVYLSCLHKC